MKSFFRAAGIRALRTAAQTAGSMLVVGTFMSDIDWLHVGSATLLATIFSMVTSLATGLPEVPGDQREGG